MQLRHTEQSEATINLGNTYINFNQKTVQLMFSTPDKDLLLTISTDELERLLDHLLTVQACQ